MRPDVETTAWMEARRDGWLMMIRFVMFTNVFSKNLMMFFARDCF